MKVWDDRWSTRHHYGDPDRHYCARHRSEGTRVVEYSWLAHAADHHRHRRHCTNRIPRSILARPKLAFFDLGQVDIELIEPIDHPSRGNDQLNEHGESLHYILLEIKGMDDKLAYLDSKNSPLVQRGEYAGGMRMSTEVNT